MTKYQITINRADCIQCGSCYSIDQNHFEPDDDYTSKVVNGKTTAETSEGTFDDDNLSIAQKAVEKCPMQIISIKEI
ncbi:MAG: ferredoxin [Candidatus Thorarchaeota archaeon]